ncbi:MAG: RluA family pseudouridine synthase [Planctomycetaceae bacterium]
MALLRCPVVDPGWIIHRDSRLLVLDKPSGLLAVPGRGPDLQDCLSARVQRAFPTALVVHRLDRDTSGLMLMALDAEAQRHVGGQFERREVRKTYECVVRGEPGTDAGEIDLPIARDLARPPRYRIDHERGRPSQTRWRVIDRTAGAGLVAPENPDPAMSPGSPERKRRDQHDENTERFIRAGGSAYIDISRLEVEPLTGRSHQIRLHLAVLGHPILGDPLYADAATAALAPRLLLHATRLALAHPDDGRPVAWASPCPFTRGPLAS